MFKFLLIATVAALPALGRADTRLLMAEERGCPWCARWNDEVGEIYGKTPEGKAAPLRRYDIDTPLPGDVTLDGKIYFTPTFVLLKDGTEVDRIEGYPGEAFFWGLLGQMLDEAEVPVANRVDG